MRVETPAKINLFLEVTGQRSDGYHTLETIFQAVDLEDTLTVERIPKGIRCLGGPRGLAPQKNLVVKAAQAFLEKHPLPFGVSFRLEKKIPVGGGMGGGSSDAAAALAALERFSGRKIPDLDRIAVGLGADVPFFLKGGTCLARGIGEKLTPIQAKPFWVVLVNPGFPIPTAGVFKSLQKPLTNKRKVHKMRALLEQGAPLALWARELYNRLEEAVLPVTPVVGEIKRALLHHGAVGALLSGSGATVFGIVSSREAGLKIQRALRGNPRWTVTLSKSVRRGIELHGNHRDPSVPTGRRPA